MKLFLLLLLLPTLCFSQDAWTQLQDFPEAVVGRGEFVINGEAYVIISPELTATSPKSLYKFNPTNETFEYLSAFPDVSYNSQLEFEDRLFLIRAEVSDNGSTFTAIEYFPESNELIERSTIEAQGFFSVSGEWISGYVYSGLGYVLTNGDMDNSFTYDAEEDLWTTTGRVEFPFCSGPGTTFRIEENAYFIYEEDCEGDRSNEVWQYSLLSQDLEQKGHIPGGENYSPETFVIDGLGYLGMGETIPGVVSNGFMRYYPETDDWEIISACGYSARAPFTFVSNDVAYVGVGNDPGQFPENTDEVWRLDPELLSVQGVSQPEISLYPNPVTNILNVSNAPVNSVFTIYNLSGQEVGQYEDGEAISVSALSRGLNFLEISHESGVQVVKFLKD